jgi:hypothetical protein
MAAQQQTTQQQQHRKEAEACEHNTEWLYVCACVVV